ncbi:flagellar sheath protein A [Vibrio harveyi]|uniref:flagellar sheath protein A n=1 Tax=Vibrio harveyi TaxID=669 RepID=UPI001262CF97|nr:flagellar sheath protein A [Vibrio harveyi]QFQ78049.1 flagellar sheath protein A [Vibrio harveyi]
MKQLKVLPLVAIISGLMVGCGGGGGGGGGGPAPAPKYTWQIVNLYVADKSEVKAGCVIYDELKGNSDKVITAKVANAGFKVLYHNADGAVISDQTIENIPSNGKVTIDSGKVPDEGYVSLEELDGTIGGTQDVYMFTVQKEFLQNMTVNVRQAQSSLNSCVLGEQNTSSTSENAVINVAQSSSSTQFYQSSFIDAQVDGHQVASNIPVVAPLKTDEKVLITAFDSLSSNQHGDLKYFVLAEGSAIYDVTNPPTSVPTIFMKPVSRSDVNLTVSGIALNNNSSVEVGLNNEIYQWQPIYNSTDSLSYTDSDLSASGWTAELEGVITSGNWNYYSLNAYDGSDLNIDAPVVSNFDSSIVSSSCSLGNFCLSAVGFNSGDFDIQRTHLRSTTSNGNRNFYQTIFAKPNSNQVFMESSEEVLVPNNSVDRLEVSTASLDSLKSAPIMYFLSNSLDIQSVVTTSVLDFSDVNGLVSTASDLKKRKLGLMAENVTIIENGKN